MENAKLILSKDFKVALVEDSLFGSFVEHMGSVVYNGIFEPGHTSSDNNGFRGDVIKLVKELNLSVVRYPGGNFSSGYNWEDTVGPLENRPVKLDLAWRAFEPNTFGLYEFMKWANIVGSEPIITVNLGTRGVDAARALIEYCNFEKGSYWSNMRIAHGAKEPYKIKTWCLGNELDGNWQLGGKTADEYGRLAYETAKAMRQVDPDIKLIAVGSSQRYLSSFPQWDETVLSHTYEMVDYIALHHYIDKSSDDTATYLARSIDMEKQIHEIIATCDYVKSKKRSSKTIQLSFDEWNVHRQPDVEYIPWQTGCPLDWVSFSMEDTLVFGSMLLTLLRNSDRVKIACQSLLVNTIPLILTEKLGKAWRNAIFYPFLHASLYGRGTVLHNVLESPKYDTDIFNNVPYVDSVTVYNEENGEITLFAINRGLNKLTLKTDARDFGRLEVIEHIVIKNDNLDASNTSKNTFEVTPSICRNSKVESGMIESLLDGYSWNVIRIKETNNRNI
jgi:alpha-N-arabinofuranosidase